MTESELTPEDAAGVRVALERLAAESEAARPHIERLLVSLLTERYPAVRERLVSMGYSMDWDGIMAAIEHFGDEREDAQVWHALDQALVSATDAGVTLRRDEPLIPAH